MHYQEKMRGQSGRLPVQPLGYVMSTKVIFRRVEVFRDVSMQVNLGLMFERKAKISCNDGRSGLDVCACGRLGRQTSARTKTFARLKITFVDMTYPGQRPEPPSLSPHFLLALPIYLQQELERVQKRAFSIINSGQDYHEILEAAGMPPIMAYIEDSCSNLFSNIIENDNHRLCELLPSANHPKHNLRRKRLFEIPRWRTNRFKNAFMMSSTIK